MRAGESWPLHDLCMLIFVWRLSKQHCVLYYRENTVKTQFIFFQCEALNVLLTICHSQLLSTFILVLPWLNSLAEGGQSKAKHLKINGWVWHENDWGN